MAADHDDALTKEEMQPITWIEWYDSLAKPSWTPSLATIGLIWMILYPIILVSFGFVFVQAFRSKVPRMVAVPFAVNLVANLMFMPLFSGLRSVIAFSYRATVQTKKDEWIEVKVPLDKFKATSFGRLVGDAGPVDPKEINALGFLLGDKKAGPFKMEIEWNKVVRAAAAKGPSSSTNATCDESTDSLRTA
jgi:hypothetical protein